VPLTLAVIRETAESETRVAATPETVKKITALGLSVRVETGAGAASSFPDQDYVNAGAVIAANAHDTAQGADIVLRVQATGAGDIAGLRSGALLIGLMDPYRNPKFIQSCAESGIDAMAMDLVPRITRAQGMDVLSSQSNLAGYRAVLDAAAHFTRAFPMMMTAAGTIPPAKVFVMGAGVAGLQAIATAKRLGASVSATDVRPASKEQVKSLGGSFIAVEDEEFKAAETSGGYAKEMSPEYKAKQAALVESHIAKQDIVITTALIPGRPAPKLVSETMVKSMRPGSVIVDLAVESGGNCAVSEAGNVILKHGVVILGYRNMAGRLATDASSLYARNILNLLTLIVDKDTGALKIDAGDEIIKGIALTREGAVIHPQFGQKSDERKTA